MRLLLILCDEVTEMPSIHLGYDNSIPGHPQVIEMLDSKLFQGHAPDGNHPSRLMVLASRAVGTRRRLAVMCVALVLFAAVQIWGSFQLLRMGEWYQSLGQAREDFDSLVWGSLACQWAAILFTSVLIPVQAFFALHVLVFQGAKKPKNV